MGKPQLHVSTEASQAGQAQAAVHGGRDGSVGFGQRRLRLWVTNGHVGWASSHADAAGQVALRRAARRAVSPSATERSPTPTPSCSGARPVASLGHAARAQTVAHQKRTWIAIGRTSLPPGLLQAVKQSWHVRERARQHLVYTRRSANFATEQEMVVARTCW